MVLNAAVLNAVVLNTVEQNCARATGNFVSSFQA